MTYCIVATAHVCHLLRQIDNPKIKRELTFMLRRSR